MDQEITLRISIREALALLAAVLELGLGRQESRPHLGDAELRLSKAIYDASLANQEARQATRTEETEDRP